MHKVITHSKRILIGIVGGIVVLAGLIMVPYPGPGWLVVFAGLAILATEFDSAQRLLDLAKDKYDSWQNWVVRQSLIIRILIWSVTAVIVVVTVWLVNGYGIMSQFLGLDWDWLSSPLFR
jgi:uncharacterized protein (TIGR02611 family)